MPRFAVTARLSGCLLLILALGLTACSDDSTGPDTESFQLLVTVTDPGGDPVSGLRVSAWSLIPAEITQDGKWAEGLVAAASPVRATTVFSFTLAEPCSVTYKLFDATDQMICTLFDQNAPVGRHTVQWNGTHCDQDFPEAAFSGTYRAVFTARDSDSGEIIHTDEILAVMYLADPDQQILGFTDRTGRLVTEDRSFFPHLFQWPPFVWTDEVGSTLGTFAYTGSVRIALYDASTTFTWFQDFAVGEGENKLQIIWDPFKMAPMAAGAAGAADASAPGSTTAQFTRVNSESKIPPPIRTEIHQNYPNPFN